MRLKQGTATFPYRRWPRSAWKKLGPFLVLLQDMIHLPTALLRKEQGDRTQTRIWVSPLSNGSQPHELNPNMVPIANCHGPCNRSTKSGVSVNTILSRNGNSHMAVASSFSSIFRPLTLSYQKLRPGL